MKSSEILCKALERMDGGKKWVQGAYFDGERCCSLGAIQEVTDTDTSNEYVHARNYLMRGAQAEYPAPWNDSAPDFSVIQQGFEAAIKLAEAEGD